MRNFTVYSVMIVLAVFLSQDLMAQYPIPSFNAQIISDPTIFQELQENTSTSSTPWWYPLLEKPSSRGDRLLTATVYHQNPKTTATATFFVYSLEGTYNYGPFYIEEGDNFEIIVSDTLLWGLRVIDASEDCIMDVWFEE